MGPQTRTPPVDYHSYSNAGQQEGSWSSDSYFNAQPLYFYPLSNTQGSPQPLEDGTVPASNCSAEPIVADAAQAYPHPDPRELIPHPIIQDTFALTKYDGTVLWVYGPPLYHFGPNGPEFPPLSQEVSRVVIPQTPYACGNTQKEWIPKPTIYFFTRRRHGVKLVDALEGRFEGVDDRDSPPFDPVCRGITVRMHFPGYTSSTEVEKELKKRAGGCRETKSKSKEVKAKSMQLSTKDYRDPPKPVTKSKLVQEVSKRILWHISDLEANSGLFPFDDRVGKKWRLEHGRMRFDRMVITGLVNVSSGSWSPIICVE